MKRASAFFLAAALLAAGLAQAKVMVGCPVTIDEPVDGDLFAAGCEVKVDTRVDGNVRMAGGSLQLGPNAIVTGDVSIAGGEVAVKGTVNGSVHAAGGHVLLDGKIERNADEGAGAVELGPNAKIDGRLRYRSDSFERDSAATVAKGVERTTRRSRHYHHDSDWDEFPHSVMRWIWTAGLMLIAGMFAALMPGVSGRFVEEVRERPWMTLLTGFIAFVCIPIAAVMLMVTVIGIPIGILTLMAYMALLLVGYVTTSVVVAGLVLDRVNGEAAQHAGWRAAAAVAAMLVIALIGRIPVIGHSFSFAMLIVGVGIIVATILHRHWPAGRTPAPAA